MNAMVYQGFVDPSAFKLFTASLPVLFMIIVGGLGQTGDTSLFFPFDVVVDIAGRMVVTDGEN